ncbi:hypothetical protein phi16_gp028 [Corynebacterium phage phi16]|uniref:tyrosine-type recombinase/integrase n=1 Tax=Corynebacterium glutamicum TaxID=1718 RepID=UPI000943EA4A|nr:site-specific integrase [Corynebacterium glutamicum]APQ42606.1 hypothetical protein phi16_gp028 [Corynebacterium phage phi16]OKX80474.1 hypothetical protein AUO95_09970 [Corynebacterium glutamicum]
MEALNPIPPGREHWVVSPETAAAEWIGGFPKGTRASYGPILRKWLWWCQDSHLDAWSASRIHIEQWLQDMKPHAGRQAATIVCGFYRDAHGRGFTKTDLAWGVRRPKAGRHRAGTYATPQEMQRMVNISKSLPPDDQAVMMILLLTGSRISETCEINIGDVEDEGRVLRMVLRRKGHHIDALTMPPTITDVVRRLMKKRSTGALLRVDGRRMTPAYVRGLVSMVAEMAECEQKISPHSLRRSFVTFARDLGVDDRDIMAMTGHSDASMIDYYDRGRRQRDGLASFTVDEALKDVT